MWTQAARDAAQRKTYAQSSVTSKNRNELAKYLRQRRGNLKTQTGSKPENAQSAYADTYAAAESTKLRNLMRQRKKK